FLLMSVLVGPLLLRTPLYLLFLIATRCLTYHARMLNIFHKLNLRSCHGYFFPCRHSLSVQAFAFRGRLMSLLGLRPAGSLRGLLSRRSLMPALQAIGGNTPNSLPA